MKKMIIPGMALLLSAEAVQAQAQPQPKSDFKYGLSEIAVAPFEKIRIHANVQVVLVPNANVQKVFVEGNEKMLNSITVISKNNEMVIDTNPAFAATERLLVTIPVSNLKQIDMKGEIKLGTAGN